MLLILSVGVGCGQPVTLSRSTVTASQAEPVSLPTSGPTLEATATNTRVIPLDSLTPSPTPTVTPIPDEVRGLVVEVIDGHTIGVVLEGDSPRQIYEVSYIGIESPPNEEDTPWGVVAYETNRRMTNLEVVRLVRDREELDSDGRLWRYVYVGDELMSIILTEQGLAQAAIEAPNTRFEEEILEAETRAREGELGLWSEDTPTPTPSRTRTGEVAEEITPEATNESEEEPSDDTAESSDDATATPVPEEGTVEPTDTSTTTVTVEATTITPTISPTSTVSPTVESTTTPTPEPTTEATAEADELQGPQ